MDITLHMALSPEEVDEVIAGLKAHSANINKLADRILSEAQGQVSSIINKQQEMEEKIKENKKRGEVKK